MATEQSKLEILVANSNQEQERRHRISRPTEESQVHQGVPKFIDGEIEDDDKKLPQAVVGADGRLEFPYMK